jgi:hypothetical protein
MFLPINIMMDCISHIDQQSRFNNIYYSFFAYIGGKMSVFLMGVYDPGTFRWCTVTKCGNGFDDKMLAKLQKQLDVIKINKVRCLNHILTFARLALEISTAQYSHSVFHLDFKCICIDDESTVLLSNREVGFSGRFQGLEQAVSS